MLTKHQIIEKLYKDKYLDELIQKLNWYENEDFKQELFIILLEQKDEKIIELYQKNQIWPFINKIITNQTHSKTSKFYKLYRKHNKELFIQLSEDGLYSVRLENFPEEETKEDKDYYEYLEDVKEQVRQEIESIEDLFTRTLIKYVIMSRLSVQFISKFTKIPSHKIYKIVADEKLKIYLKMKEKGIIIPKFLPKRYRKQYQN